MKKPTPHISAPAPRGRASECLLPADKVIFSIPEESLPELPESHKTFGIIGQERAMQAIDMALSIPSKGYNVFATGPAGTGKRTAILHILKNMPSRPELLQDIAAVHNPVQEDAPRILYFPKGQAVPFRRAMRKTVLDIQSLAQEIQGQSRFLQARDQYIIKAESEENQILFDFEDKLEQEGFKIVQVEEDNQEKTDLAAMVNDNLTSLQEMHHMAAQGELKEDHYQSLREKYFELMDEMKQLFSDIQRRRRRLEQYMLELLQASLEPEIKVRLESIRHDFPYPEVSRHLDDLAADMIEHLPLFLADPDQDIEEHEQAASSPPPPPEEEEAPPKKGRGRSLLKGRKRRPRGGDAGTSNADSLAVPLPGPLALADRRTGGKQPRQKPGRNPRPGEYLAGLLPGNLLHLPEHLLRYDVHILIDHSATEKPPVIFETYPDFQKLFGTIDLTEGSYGPPGTQSAMSPGAAVAAGLGLEKPGFLSLRPGSLLRANGGYLILQAEDLLMEEETYTSLKRVLQNGTLEIRTSPGAAGGHGASSLKPEPIKINLKVVILGSEMLYDALYLQDEDFQKLFKVPAEFDYTMDRNEHTTREYMHFIRMVQEDEGLLPVEPSAVVALLEYGVRLAELRSKLCTKFSLIADILRESSFWASRMERKTIDRSTIDQALAKRAFLLNLPEEKIDEQIRTGELLMQLEGSAVGRVNGLAVLDRGYYSFGRPTVISAMAAPGTDGIINVEREAGLSGEIHDKGTYIVESYIHATYAQDFPFSITARICFEQSYVEVDGDSASSTEVYALLSAIGKIPLRQDVAVTGSVNQMGEIQPVGGVIEKVEGFFQVCTQRGLTGSQGVIIPIQNVEGLILNSQVNEAVKKGEFHIWAIGHVDQGMEILTGLEPGVRSAKGAYPAQSFHGKIEKELRRMARITSKETD